jgi:hypothetical protein
VDREIEDSYCIDWWMLMPSTFAPLSTFSRPIFTACSSISCDKGDNSIYIAAPGWIGTDGKEIRDAAAGDSTAVSIIIIMCKKTADYLTMWRKRCTFVA